MLRKQGGCRLRQRYCSGSAVLSTTTRQSITSQYIQISEDREVYISISYAI